MPQCQGLPDGPCPRNINNRTVKPTQGDLFLCPSCDAVHFPYAYPKMAAAAAKKKAANTGKTVGGKSQTRLKQQITTTDTIKPDDDYCPHCNEVASENSSCIECNICQNIYHQHCTSLSTSVFDALLSIIEHTGWVCEQCRNEHNSQLNKLHSALARTNEELADMRVSLAWLQSEIETIKNPPAAAAPNHCTTAGVSQQTETVTHCEWPTVQAAAQLQKVRVPDITVEIHRAINDVARRKCNVVITGLQEPTGSTDDEHKHADEEAFRQLCEEHLSLKPCLARKGCVRLGQLNGDRPRRLLVHLISETTASDLITAAKQLRNCQDQLIANTVYINADLSPADAKLAFENRERKRATAARRNTSNIKTLAQNRAHNETAEEAENITGTNNDDDSATTQHAEAARTDVGTDSTFLGV